MLGYSYPLLNVFWTLLRFFALVLFIWLFITVVIDVFRSHDLGGWGKAGWLIFFIVLPIIGLLVYLIARGGSMHERQVASLRQQEQEFRSHVQDVTSTSTADELVKLDDLRKRGVITEEEFQAQKVKLLS
ncbi:MAG TPA: SHOCT domain-containing protein [Acidimicrobiales bacterium]|nr:SHOCT domain-containing protein [Acidimicrobiales bacterium]